MLEWEWLYFKRADNSAGDYVLWEAQNARVSFIFTSFP